MSEIVVSQLVNKSISQLVNESWVLSLIVLLESLSL